jgi:ABC-2 type transport system permease protein
MTAASTATVIHHNAGASSIGAVTSPLWPCALSLCYREVIRFVRQPARVVGAIGTPLLFWILFGAGLDRSFRMGSDAGGPSFREYYFPGTLVLIVLFTAIFTSISIIEDRREGFLQAVLVAPVSRWAIVLGKVLGGTILAVAQGGLFLLLGFLLPLKADWLAWCQVGLLLTLAAMAMTALGFTFAWRVDSTQGFHSVMNLVLMPMWMLSGAFFPIPAVDSNSSWGQTALHWIMRCNPLTYCVHGVRQLILGSQSVDGFWSPNMTTCWLVTLGFVAVTMFVAARTVSVRTAGDLQ